jgi:hypothetical protein
MHTDEAVEVLAALEAARKELRETNDPTEASLRNAVVHLARTYRQPHRHTLPATALVMHTDAHLTAGIGPSDGQVVGSEALRRIACDASVRHVSASREHNAGRARRTIYRAQRRALARRDGISRPRGGWRPHGRGLSRASSAKLNHFEPLLTFGSSLSNLGVNPAYGS